MALRWLAYILAIIVSVQTFAAVVDEHQSHQSGTQHLEFDDHAHDDQALGEQALKNLDRAPYDTFPDNSVKNTFDCHHCCHCHGGHLNLLVFTKISNTPIAYNTDPLGYVSPAQNGVKTHPYRPPKA